MRYFIFLLILTVFNCSAQSKNKKDCQRFKSGKFTYLTPNNLNTTVLRTDSTQIEFNKSTGLKLTASIKWKSNCSYELTYTKVNKSKYDMVIGLTFDVDILSTSENSFKYRAYDGTKEVKGEMIKLDN